MHEMALAQSVLSIVEDAAVKQGFSRVTALRLEIGRLSGVEPDALRFCLDVVIRDSLANGARLELIESPGRAWCMQCSRSVAVSARYDACPECGSYQLQVTGGTEMRVKELEVE